MAKDVDNSLKCILVPCNNIWSNIALLLSADEAVSDKAVLLPAENDKYNLVTLKSVPLTVGKKVIVFPAYGDKNHLVAHANPQPLFISGYVRDWDLKPVEHERINLITSQTDFVRSRDTGYYKFWVLQGHDYIVRADEDCFSPEQYSFSNLSASQQYKSFYEIAVLGNVFHSDGTPFPGITIHIPGATNSDSADSDGAYVLTRVNRGNCIVKPVFSGVFLPEQYEFTPILEKQVDKDFIERCGYSVQGYVFESDGETPIPDHRVFAIGDKEGSILSAEDGEYILSVMDDYTKLCIDENYEVYPDKRWYFHPSQYIYEPLGGFKTNQNFVKGTTFYQKTVTNGVYYWAWGNYWPGGGSFPIPGEDYVQKVRFGATVTIKEGTLQDRLDMISFSGKVVDYGTLWSIGGFTAVGQTKHAEVFFLDYEPWMTPYKFYVYYSIGGYKNEKKTILDFHGEIEFLYEESPPSVETLDATNVTDTTATLNGRLHEIGWEECTVWFEWVYDKENYDHETTPESFNLKWYFSADITGLVPQVGYFFRAVVQSGENTYYGADKNFMNPASAPDPPVETLDATNVTDTTATLNGKLDILGWEECEVWFEWNEFGNKYRTASESIFLQWYFSAELSWLVSDQEYWFRAIVRSGGTKYYGNWKYFKTLPFDRGNIYCDTFPTGANIFIDGRLATSLTTPTTLFDISPGTHWITFRKGPNYINRDIEVTVVGGKTANAI